MTKSLSRSYDTFLTALAPAIWGSTYLVTTEFLPAGYPLTLAVLRALPAGLLLMPADPRFATKSLAWPALFARNTEFCALLEPAFRVGLSAPRRSGSNIGGDTAADGVVVGPLCPEHTLAHRFGACGSLRHSRCGHAADRARGKA